MVLVLSGCDATRHLAKDELLLRATPRFEGNQSLSDEVLLEGVKTLPNKQFLNGPKLKLSLYNMGLTIREDSSTLKKIYQKFDRGGYYVNGLSNVLTENMGEPPALIDRKQLQEDAENLQKIYFSEGFFQAKVKARIIRSRLNPKVADVVFKVQERVPYVFRKINYVTEDTAVAVILDSGRAKSLLQPGKRYSDTKITAERQRISNLMRDLGYFRFTVDSIRFGLDTFRTAALDTTGMRQRLKTLQLDDSRKNRRLFKKTVQTKEEKHYIDVNVILPDYAERYTLVRINATIRKPGQTEKDDKVVFNLGKMSPAIRKAYGLSDRWRNTDYDVYITTLPGIARELNLNLVARRILLHEGQTFSLQTGRKTQQLLQGLGIFRNAILTYTPIDSNNTLVANLELPLLRYFNFSIGAEATTTQDARLGNNNIPGVGVSLTARNRNAFTHAENLELVASGNAGFYTAAPGEPTQPLYQYNVRANFSIPRLWPLETPRRNFVNFRPTTTVSVAYNEEQRVQFQRRSVISELHYNWFNIPFSNRAQMSYSPLSLLWVQSDTIADFSKSAFPGVDANIVQFILRDFRPRYNTKSTFYYTYSANYGLSRAHASWWIRPGVEMGGNIPLLIDYITRQTGSVRGGSISDGLVNNLYLYGNFLRASFEARLFVPLGNDAEFVSRFFTGWSASLFYPSRIIPFENRFYAGGTNSIRGWQSGTLGPGTYQFPSESRFNNLIAPGGEYALEMNYELRFKMISFMRGALFVDAGNVWFGPNSSFDERGLFKGSNLQLGVAAGVGLRFDFSFFIFRLDFGQQIYAPDIQRLVVVSWPRDIGGTRLQWNIGIGYPF